MNTNHDKVAYVTGGTSGIGMAIVKGLAEEGYAVAFSSRSQERIDRVLEALR